MLHMFRQANRSNEMVEHHCIIIDKAFRDRMMEVQKIEKMVNDAIENNRIEVYYQPIYSTEKHIFTSAEALVRIRDDKGKIIPPATFIEIAERNGTILKLGEIIFENVCTFIETSDVLQYGLEYIEVNLSVVQCEHEDLAKEFIGIMRKHNISGETINLEITETATLASKKKLIANMIALRNYGVGFSLDDFGTGRRERSDVLRSPKGRRLMEQDDLREHPVARQQVLVSGHAQHTRCEQLQDFSLCRSGSRPCRGATDAREYL